MEHDYDRITQYLDGTLHPAEQAEFEKRLSEDADLRQQLMIARQARRAITGAARRQIRDWVDEAADQAKSPRLTPRLRSVLTAAAGVAMIVGIFAILRPYLQRPGVEVLIAEYYSVPQIPVDRSSTPELSTQWIAAQEAYMAQKWGVVVEQIPLLLSDTTFHQPSRARLMLAIAHWESGNLIETISTLQQISDNSLLVQEKQWYLALAYLKNGNTEQSLSVLRQIARDDRHDQRELARRLLRQLN